MRACGGTCGGTYGGVVWFSQIRLHTPFFRGVDMQIAVAEVPLLAEEQVAEETLQIDRGVVYAFHGILVVGADKGVAEIPRVFGKQVVLNVKAYRAQVLYGEHGRGAGVAFAESVDLPKSGDETGDMSDKVVLCEAFITELPLLFDVVVQCPAQVFPVQVIHRVAFQHPFLLGDVVVAQLAGVFEDAFEAAAVQRDKTVGGEVDRFHGEYLLNVSRCLVGFILVVIMGLARGFAFVIAVEQRVDLIHGKLAFDVAARQVIEVLRGREPIDGLQADGRTPSIGGLALSGLSLPDIFIKVYVVVLFGHGVSS